MNKFKPYYKANNFDNVTIPYEMHKEEVAFRIHLIDLRENTAYMEKSNWSNGELELLIHYFNNLCGVSEIAVFLQKTEPDVMHKIEELDLYNANTPFANHEVYPKDMILEPLQKISDMFSSTTES